MMFSLLKSNSSPFSVGHFSSRPVARRIFLSGNGVVIAAVSNSSDELPGLVFKPFEEMKPLMNAPSSYPQQSLARHKYTDEVEAALNYQINVEFNASYVYHSLHTYFDRDCVALKGFARFFMEASKEETEHAERLMEYQNKQRGGKVKLLKPLSDFDHPEKGDALHAMETALALEKLVNDKLLHLHSVAEQNKDVQLMDFIEGEFLKEQVDAIKKLSDYVSQLKRAGKGHGVWHFDQALLA